MKFTEQIRVLFVEDMAPDMELAQHVMKREGLVFTSIRVETESEFLTALKDFKPDIVISDYSMPQFDGMRALEISLREDPTLPFIILTGTLNEETAVKCIKSGATDYVIKERIARLPFAVSEALAQHKMQKEKEAAEKALHESEERFSKAFHTSPSCNMITTYPEGKIIDINEAYCQLLKTTRDQLVNRFTRDINIWASEEQKAEIFREFERTGCIQNREVTFRNMHNELLIVLASVEKIEIYGQKCVISTVVDITARKHAEEQLIAAKIKAEESDKLKSAFLANMSHEIRTPMNGILGFLDLLNEPDLTEENKAEYISLVEQSGRRLLDTINDIIEVSRIESGEISPKISAMNLGEVMNFMLEFFQQQANESGLALSIETQLQCSGACLNTDKHKLETILINLIKNAIKYTKYGSIEFGNYLTDESIVFYVRDTGIGIPADRLDAIFDRFVQADVLAYSRPYEGSGLGLSIVKAYVKVLGGKIRVESTPGKGSVFYVSLPYTPTERMEPVPIPGKSEVAGRLAGFSILVAEDDDVNYHYINIILTRAGAKLFRANDGLQCVKMARELNNISAIIMDIKMPGLNGFEATGKIREFNTEVPVLAFTAFAFPGDREQAITSGCNDYLAKPVNQNEIISLIEKYVKK